MKRNADILSILFTILFISCSNGNNNMVFFKWRGQEIWQKAKSCRTDDVVKKEISLGRTGLYTPFFDNKTGKKYLVFTLRKEGTTFNSEAVIYELCDDEGIENCYKYSFKRNDEVFGSYIQGIYDSVVLASSSFSQYELFHLETGFIEFIDIQDNANELAPIAFKNGRIFFLNGFYDCKFKKFCYYPSEWNITKKIEDRIVGIKFAYPNVSSDGKKLVARNELGNIIIFDLETSKSFNTGIQRECNEHLNYKGNLLYCLDNENLYFSKDSFFSRYFNFPSFVENEVYPSLVWYCYDTATQKVTKVKSPSGTVFPVGQTDF